MPAPRRARRRSPQALTRVTLAAGILAAPLGMAAQETPPAGLQWSALPALNYDSDNGFGYGVAGGLYRYGGARPLYDWSFEPTVFLTTKGRKDLVATLDVPYFARGTGRLTVYAGYEGDCCRPYYGFGNASTYDAARADPAEGPNYYTYDWRRLSLVTDLQWRIAGRWRVLTGFAAYHNRSGARDSVTAFAADSAGLVLAPYEFSAASVGPKLGLVYDSRDQERDPRSGAWAEALVWRGLGGFADDRAFTRVSATLRGYLPVGPRLTLAGRATAERVFGDLPAAMLSDMASSFRDYPGMGGGSTIRGVLRNRYLGESRVLGNLELRIRAAPTTFLKQRWRLGAVAFVDAGRVWDDRGPDGSGVGLHWGEGAGARIGWGDAFIIALDFAHGTEAGLQMYLGLGHLF